MVAPAHPLRRRLPSSRARRWRACARSSVQTAPAPSLPLLAYTASRPARREDRRLRNLLGILALGYLPLMLTPGIPWMSPLAFLSGCALPMVLAAMFTVVASIAPAGTITEAHAWMITSFGVGSAAGSAVAGLILDSHTANWTFVLAAGCACAGILPALAPLLHDRSS